ncbi:MAG TPA: VTC domain-containing protein [Kofleriaceae bacterium]|nr:VTC domain-containing protein [Kofleriaceae bacterium]
MRSLAPMLHVGTPEVEHRFLVDAEEADRIAVLAAHFLSEDSHDPVYLVNHVVTTYYDTEDRELFRGELFHGRDRVRVRQYAVADTSVSTPVFGEVAAFELKRVSSGSRKKARLVADVEHIEHLLQRDGYRSDPDAAELAPMRNAARQIATGVLWPTLTTWARRRAFTGPGYRLTIDHDVVFTQPTPLRWPGEPATPGAVITRMAQRVVEIKRTGPVPQWLARATQSFRGADEFSKYREGMLASQRIDMLAAAARAPSPPPPRPPTDSDPDILVFDEYTSNAENAFERESWVG